MSKDSYDINDPIDKDQVIDQQYRKHDTDCDRTIASLVCSDCETELWSDNERLAKLEEMN